jgi:Holliday junction resolvase RusA-like endonuclease
MKITVHGTPAPQGSKRHVGGGRMIESSAKVKPWREAVKWAAIEAAKSTPGPVELWQIDTALVVEMCFYLQRPQSHYGTGRNACTLKPSAPKYPITKPDTDKLIRSTLDALSDAGIWADDSRAVTVMADKRYADDRVPGAEITVDALP